MRYWIIKFAIQHGELGFHSINIEKTDDDTEYDADADAKTYYGGKEGEKIDPDSDWYNYYAGEIAVRVASRMEISKTEYDILNKYCELNKEDIKKRKIKKMEEDLAKLKANENR